MSLENREDQLLAQALADALEQDIAEVPVREYLQGEHCFSEKFEKQMQQMIENQEENENNVRIIHWGKMARRYGAWAAVLVCVLGLGYLAAGLGGFLRMGSKGDQAFSTAEGVFESAAIEDAKAEDYAEAPAEAEEAFESVESESGAGDIEKELPTIEEPAAPDWQEQILAESAKADKLAAWSFVQLCPDDTFELGTEVQPVTPQVPNIRVSEIYEIYYQTADGWLRIYQGPVHTTECSDTTTTYWVDGYVRAEYGLNKPGIYRMVRLVNQYRQALDVEISSR